MAVLPPTSLMYLGAESPAETYLKALDPDAKQFIFVMIARDKKTQSGLFAPSKKTLGTIQSRNTAGENAYITVNAMTGEKRKREEVSRLRCLFADDDGKQAYKEYPLPPSMVVTTSPGKKQVYWLLENDPSINIDEWDMVQQTIVNEYGGDPNARDAARILRLPGFLNKKEEYGPEYPLCTLDFIDESRRYSWKQIREKFPLSEIVHAGGQAKGEGIDLRSTMEQFISGENYHEAGLRLAGYYYNSGIKDRDRLLLHLQSLIDIQGDPNDPRFIQRRETDLPGSVDWIIQERRKEEEPEVTWETTEEAEGEKKKEFTNLPIPGGAAHKVYEWVLATMYHKNDDIAVVATEHILSVFGGGHWHLGRNNTMRKRVVLGQMGSGKNTVKSCMDALMTKLEEIPPGGTIPYLTNSRLYHGSDAFTFANQHLELMEHRVRSFILPEAGVSKTSTAGDVKTHQAWQMQMLSTKVGYYHDAKSFSRMGKVEDRKELEPLNSPCGVFLHESTVENYSKTLMDDNAFVTGDLSRTDIIFIDPFIDVQRSDIKASRTEIPNDVLGIILMLCRDFRNLPCKGSGSYSGDVWEEIDTKEIDSRLNEIFSQAAIDKNKANAKNDLVGVSEAGRKYERLVGSVLINATADEAYRAFLAGEDRLKTPVAKPHHLDYAIKRNKAVDDTVRWHSKSGGNLSDDSLQKAMEHFRKGMKRWTGKTRLEQGRYGMTKTKEGGYFVTWTMLSKLIQKNSPCGDYIEKIHRGDIMKAKRALLDNVCEMNFGKPVTYEDKMGAVRLKRPLQWEIYGAFVKRP